MTEKVKLTVPETGEEVEFYVIEQTRINNTNYILVTESDDETEEADAYVLKDLSKDSVTFENCRVSKIMWCGDESCLSENSNNLNIISFNQQRSSEYCYFCQKKAKHQVSIIKKI